MTHCLGIGDIDMLLYSLEPLFKSKQVYKYLVIKLSSYVFNFNF